MDFSNGIIHWLANSAALNEVRQGIDEEALLAEAIAVQQIPAPTFAEGPRAEYVRRRFEQAGLQDARVDVLFNVVGRWPGTYPDRPAVMLSAHLDTVFGAGADLSVRREGNRLYGPGIGDNSVAVAGLLALLDLFARHSIRPDADIWFVANSREEGLGNLDGIRAVWEQLHDRLGAALVVEGMALGRVYRAGIAVRRLKITCHAPGGHSWLHFGSPSAVHGLIKLGARILDIKPPEKPRTTYNIGVIEGGCSVNSLATSAHFYLDMRSETARALHTLEQAVNAAIAACRNREVTFDVEVVGDRPSGAIDPAHPLVQTAVSALHAIGIRGVLDAGSTDANVLLANGLPTITVGLSVGGNAHRPDEFVEVGPVGKGLWHLLLLVLATAQQVHTWHAD
ncbi:M20/M25/M40 family metallo-hydrolase [Aggregatilinea lenta]|uniref:M20/M25/M40 family metallo-hydrolase n=1 Tax=Aggregatilinea lenta TaxID=913108 RepID=UPI000E5C3803|nr:M20/M25/M40 family metallo-hydrolase [Aggregatilinea lenta]